MTVYVVNIPTNVERDLAAAERFGKLQQVNTRYLYGDEIGDDGAMPPAFVDNMRRCADEFQPDDDYLLIVGDHLQLIAFTAELARRYVFFRVLRWDRNEQAYFPVRIEPTASIMMGVDWGKEPGWLVPT